MSFWAISRYDSIQCLKHKKHNVESFSTYNTNIYIVPLSEGLSLNMLIKKYSSAGHEVI